MIYAKVVNGEIIEHNRSLPFSTQTTSFGINTPLEVMLASGYLPIVGTQPEYDTATHKLNGVSYEVTGTQVNKVYSVVEKTVDDLEAERKALVPQQVEMWQARAILEQAGYKPQIDAALAGDIVARNKWEYATVVKRNDDIVIYMIALLHLTETQADQLFIDASKL